MNNLILQFISMMRKGSNPESLMMNMLQQSSNPISQNLLQLAQKKDTQGIEQIARNLCAQRGLDFDKEFTAFKQQFGL